jgi:CRISPR-associated protein Cas8a1/Csx13
MVTKLKSSKVSSTRELKLTLWEQFNTPLHRVGLAGLYMSLKYLESYKGQVIDWDLTPESITLKWNCSDKEALTWLLQNTYQLDETHVEGLIKIPALGSLRIDSKIAIHNGIISTFLQHPSSVDSLGIKPCEIPLDDGEKLEEKYKAITRYNHQDLEALTKKGLYDKDDRFLSYIRIAQWLYPGATEKHVALTGKTRLQETPQGFISLLFAPIACSYYQVRSRLKANKFRWALIIPHINKLEQFAQIRLTPGFEAVSYANYFASGISDASLKYLIALAASDTADHNQTPSCEVWTFGDVAWSKQQSITARQRVVLSPQLRKKYEICDLQLGNGIKVGKKGTYIDVSFGKEIATENLVKENPWYWGLHDILKFNSEVFGRLYSEGRNLRNMNEAMISQKLTQEIATLFTDAFTWQIRERFSELKRNTSSGKPNYDKVKTDLLMEIRDCRTQQDFVKLQTFVFSRPTAIKNPFLVGVELGEFYLWIKANWQDCLSLMTLAIVSYQDPWRTPRTAAILQSKGLKKPKYLIEDEEEDKNVNNIDEVNNSNDTSSEDSEEYETTDDEGNI